jgi:TPR repeat protein
VVSERVVVLLGVLWLSLAGLVGPVRADPGAPGAAELLRMAEAGDMRAAFLLGSRFAERGGSEDEVAVQWFRLAAEGGLAEAQYNLGYMLANGRGAPRDDASAARWFRLAAEQEFVEAQFNLASFYAAGRGVEKDEAMAAAWFERAALQELPPAQHNLGLLYEFGRGVPRDLDKALAWYEQAASRGFAAARARIPGVRAQLAARAHTSPAPPQRVSGTPARAGESSIGQPRNTSWVGSQPPSSYTLQLASFLNEEEALRMLRSDLGGREAGVYAATKRGQRWYSVVMGRFPDQQAAREAVAGLPEELRRLKPWVRRFEAIQREAR